VLAKWSGSISNHDESGTSISDMLIESLSFREGRMSRHNNFVGEKMETTANTVLATDERISFLGKVYGMLSLGILVGAVGAWMSIGMAFPAEHPWIMLFAIVGSIVAANYVSRIPVVNVGFFAFFTYLTGMSMSPIIGTLVSINPAAITQAFLMTSVIFAALTGYVFYSKKDFTYLGGYLFVALISIIVIGLSNIFIFESSMLSTIISGIGILLFSAYILYDTSDILQNHDNDEYVSGAISLYLDFYLLFSNLLHFSASGDD